MRCAYTGISPTEGGGSRGCCCSNLFDILKNVVKHFNNLSFYYKLAEVPWRSGILKIELKQKKTNKGIYEFPH